MLKNKKTKVSKFIKVFFFISTSIALHSALFSKLNITNAMINITTSNNIIKPENDLRSYKFKGYYENCSIFSKIFEENFEQTSKNSIVFKTDVDVLLNKIKNSNPSDKNIIEYITDPAKIKSLKRKFCTKPLREVYGEFVTNVNKFNSSGFVKYFKVDDFSEIKNYLYAPETNKTENCDGIDGINESVLKKGDQIITINGSKVNDVSVYEKNDLINVLKESPNLNVAFERLNSQNSSTEFMRYRTGVEIDDLKKEAESFKKLRNKNSEKNDTKTDTIYIKFKAIDHNAIALLVDQLKTLDFLKIKNLVLDLSNCSGGNFNAAKNIAKLFLKKGTEYITLYNLQEYDAITTTLKNDKPPLVKTNSKDDDSVSVKIIVNENTGDAAEQLADILKTCANAKVYGKKPESKHLEYRGFDVFEFDKNRNLKKAGYILFPKTAYEAGHVSNFRNVDSINVDYECASVDQILNSLVLEKPINYEFSNEELNNIEKTNLYSKFLNNRSKAALKTRNFFSNTLNNLKPGETITIDRKYINNFVSNMNKFKEAKYENLNFSEKLFLYLLMLAKFTITSNAMIKIKTYSLKPLNFFIEQGFSKDDYRKIQYAFLKMDLDECLSMFKKFYAKNCGGLSDVEADKIQDKTDLQNPTNFVVNNPQSTKAYLEALKLNTDEIAEKKIKNLSILEAIYAYLSALAKNVVINNFSIQVDDVTISPKSYFKEDYEKVRNLFSKMEITNCLNIFKRTCDKNNINLCYISDERQDEAFIIGMLTLSVVKQL